MGDEDFDRRTEFEYKIQDLVTGLDIAQREVPQLKKEIEELNNTLSPKELEANSSYQSLLSQLRIYQECISRDSPKIKLFRNEYRKRYGHDSPY